MVMLVAGVALAVHDLGLFELDENAIAEGTPGDDWSQVEAGTDNALLSVFANDPIADPTDDIFASNSKDTLDVTDWQWKYGEPNDKNDIEHGFIATYEDNGDQIIYFGMDFIANNGDKAVGVWVMQDDVAQVEDDSPPNFPFVGQHIEGDILLQADFTNGGTLSRVDVYTWGDPTGTGDQVQSTNLYRVFEGNDCDDESPGDLACAQVNEVPETAPWPYFYKCVGSSQPAECDDAENDEVVQLSVFPVATFFEGGVNVTDLLGSSICAGSVVFETRQSQSETSVVEDKLVVPFDLCSIDVDKDGPDLSKVGDTVEYTVTVTNDGVVTMYKQSIIDSLVGDLTDGTNVAITGTDCGASLAPEADCTITYEYVVQEGDPDPLLNTVTVVYDNVVTLDGEDKSDTDDHSVELFQPSITFDKTGDTLSKVGDDVDYTITLTNTSSADSPDLECVISDDLLSLTPEQANVTLAHDDPAHVINVSRTVLGSDADPLVNTAEVDCSPIGFPNLLEASDGHSVELFQPSITFDKTGDTLSKVGDDVDYTITLTNTSSADSPDLECVISDDLLSLTPEQANVTLAHDDPAHVINVSRTVLGSDADPLVNTAEVDCSPIGFPNLLEASDGHSVELFQPSITFDKTGDTLSKVGDDVDYTITLTNTSSADSPDLECVISDDLLSLTPEQANVTLAHDDPAHVINVSRTVLGSDADPLVNTAEVDCSPIGFPNLLEASDGHSVELFQPSITFDKTGDTLSKVGDDVDYTITLTNTSSADSPDLECVISDDLLSLTPEQANVTLAHDDPAHVINVSRTVLGSDADPLVNTAEVDCSPIGFPNLLEASDGHSVELFGPSISFTKTGDDLSKIGDLVDYTITLDNTSDSDAPDLECTITDAILNIDEDVTLAWDDPAHVINVNGFEIPEGASDPFVNTAYVSCSVVDFPNVLNANDDHSVNLFQPSMKITKTGPEFGKNHNGQADEITYDIEIENTSSADTPNMSLVSVSDTLVPGLVLDPSCDDLASGEKCTDSYTYTPTVTEGEGDSLMNTISVVYSPDGFPNQIPAESSHTVTLIHPDFTVSKVCTNEPVPQDGPATWDVTVTNTGDVPLDIVADDGIGSFSLAVDGSQTFEVSQAGPFAGQATVSNTVEATWTLPASYNLTNTDTKQASDDCRVASRVNVEKTFNGVVNDTIDISFELYEGPDGFGTTPLASKSTLGDADGVLEFGVDLDPDETYTVCELGLPAGWAADWTINGSTVTPYNPNADDPVPEDLGNRCVISVLTPRFHYRPVGR